jgi:23S rRNA pseudouridine1911/1915/1917 synthase
MEEIKTIYEDDSILVVDKPNGLVVNRSNTAKNTTLQDLLEEKYEFSKKYPNTDFNDRSGIVHRLDKDTSGLLIIAKNPESFEDLQRQFKSRLVEKQYIAIVLGELKENNLEINAPLKRDPRRPLRFAISTGGRDAVTLVEKQEVIKEEDAVFTKLLVTPKTGRTHQIRVHLCAINHPIAGDPIYLTRKEFEATSKYFSRLMLHATKISFKHPVSKKTLCFESLPHF